MSETIPGGQYITANGRVVNAHGQNITPTAPVDEEPDNLRQLDGVGPSTVKKLADAGVVSFAALISAETAVLAETIGVSAAVLRDWQAQAKELLNGV